MSILVFLEKCLKVEREPSNIILKANTSNGKVDAVKITAAYPGAREFAVSIRTNLITDLRECIIYDGTVIFEKVTFEAGNNEAVNLITTLNKSSKNFIASAVDDEVPSGMLDTVTQAPMTGGKNPTVTTASYDRATNQLERVKWNCLIVDTDNVAVHALIQSFIELSYETGHFGIGCIAGKSSQDLETRMNLAASYNDEKIAYVLNGWESNSGVTYDGYLAAARIGGMIASFETNSSITHEVIKSALTLTEPLERVFTAEKWYDKYTMREKYETDLTDEQWDVIAPLFANMRKYKWDKRELTNAVLYLVKTGCQWRNLPHDFPPVFTVHSFYRRARLNGLWDRILQHLVKLTRQKADLSEEPTQALIDSQSVKTTGAVEQKGFDMGKKRKE